MYVIASFSETSILTRTVTEAETHQAADVEVMEMRQCKWEHKGVLEEWHKLVSYWHTWQGNKMGVTSSWQYYSLFYLDNYHQTVGW